MMTTLQRGYGEMITVLHRGGYAQMITILHGGGSLGTPKSDYVICARPLIVFMAGQIWITAPLFLKEFVWVMAGKILLTKTKSETKDLNS